jgi:RHS repeat-associated protein
MVYNDAVQGLALSPYGMTDASRYQVQYLAGQKQYELSNHLGNVQATVSDLPVKVGEAHTEYHAPALPAVYDYYPFGMLMPDRYTSDTSSECVTVSQTKWVTTWVTHCYLAADWVWPAYSYYGTVSVSTSSGLQIAANESSGVYFEMDVLPYEQQDVYLQTDAFYSGSGTLELQEYHGGQWHMLGSTTFDKLGEVRISIRPREDRIRAVLRGPFYVQVKQFCVQRPQLSQETVLVDICDTDGDKYRFGFNGQEKVNEWSGVGNFMDYKERGQDTRIARFLSVDPLAKKFPMLTPYQFGSNNPIMNVDLDGLEGISYRLVANVNGLSIPVARVIEVDIFMAVNKKGTDGGYSRKEADKLQKSIPAKFNTSGNIDEAGLPVYFQFNFKEFNPSNKAPNDLARERLVIDQVNTNYTEKGSERSLQSFKSMVMWMEALPGDETGNQLTNKVKIDPDRGPYERGHTENHEITHFLLQTAGSSNEQADEIPNNHHDLGGWMERGKKVVDQNGRVVETSGIDNTFSPAAKKAVIENVPRVDDKQL